jgi:hypothetical protein
MINNILFGMREAFWDAKMIHDFAQEVGAVLVVGDMVRGPVATGEMGMVLLSAPISRLHTPP